MDLPSGDQEALASLHLFPVRFFSLLPSAFMIQMSASFSWPDTNSICVPSGDQIPSEALGRSVSLVTWPPSAFMRYNLETPSASDVNIIFSPSGLHLGLSS